MNERNFCVMQEYLIITRVSIEKRLKFYLLREVKVVSVVVIKKFVKMKRFELFVISMVLMLLVCAG